MKTQKIIEIKNALDQIAQCVLEAKPVTKELFDAVDATAEAAGVKFVHELLLKLRELKGWARLDPNRDQLFEVLNNLADYMVLISRGEHHFPTQLIRSLHELISLSEGAHPLPLLPFVPYGFPEMYVLPKEISVAESKKAIESWAREINKTLSGTRHTEEAESDAILAVGHAAKRIEVKNVSRQLAFFIDVFVCYCAAVSENPEKAAELRFFMHCESAVQHILAAMEDRRLPENLDLISEMLTAIKDLDVSSTRVVRLKTTLRLSEVCANAKKSEIVTNLKKLKATILQEARAGTAGQDSAAIFKAIIKSESTDSLPTKIATFVLNSLEEGIADIKLISRAFMLISDLKSASVTKAAVADIENDAACMVSGLDVPLYDSYVQSARQKFAIGMRVLMESNRADEAEIRSALRFLGMPAAAESDMTTMREEIARIAENPAHREASSSFELVSPPDMIAIVLEELSGFPATIRSETDPATLRRVFHTIKGTALVVGLLSMSKQAEVFQDLFDAGAVAPEAYLWFADQMDAWLAEIEKSKGITSAPVRTQAPAPREAVPATQPPAETETKTQIIEAEQTNDSVIEPELAIDDNQSVTEDEGDATAEVVANIASPHVLEEIAGEHEPLVAEHADISSPQYDEAAPFADQPASAEAPAITEAVQSSGAHNDLLSRDDEIDAEIAEVFLEEAAGYVEEIEAQLLLGKDADEGIVKRALHTLKGAANSVGYKALGTAVHVIEDMIDGGADHSEVQASFDIVAIAISSLTVPVSKPQESEPKAVARAEYAERVGSASVPRMRLAPEHVGSVLDRHVGHVFVETHRLQSSVGSMLGTVQLIRGALKRLSDDLRNIEADADSVIPATYGDHRGFDNLEMDAYGRIHESTRRSRNSLIELDHLVSLLSGSTWVASQAADRSLAMTRKVKDDIDQMSLTPWQGQMPGLQRAGRTASLEAGKEIDIHLVGDADVPLQISRRMVPAIEHIIRNSVAHGIELPEARVAKGKPARGNITISCSSDYQTLLFTVEDDGAGINLDRVLAKAISAGLVPNDATRESMPDNDIAELIYHQGLSTADSVSSLAGRGVGMDVVRSTVLEMGGVIETETSSSGTVFRMRVPLDTSTMHVTPFRVGNVVMMVPVSSVAAIRRRLEDESDISYFDGLPTRADYVIETADGWGRLKIGVDEILPSKSVAVRSPGPLISALQGVLGTTVGESSKVIMIVNPARMRMATHLDIDTPRQVLLVDDSSTIRRSLKKRFEANGYVVTEAGDGAEAIGILAESNPDLVIFDIEMPVMDGFEALAILRKTKDTPAVFYSSRGTDKHRERAKELGANGFLEKNCPEHVFWEAVNAALA